MQIENLGKENYHSGYWRRFILRLEFHRTVLQQVQQYGGRNYGLVSFPDQMLTIYILFENTVCSNDPLP